MRNSWHKTNKTSRTKKEARLSKHQIPINKIALKISSKTPHQTKEITQIKIKKKNNRQLHAVINVVPYIDVRMVLLVIFMVPEPMLTQGVSVELPQASAEPVDAQDQEPMIVTVDKRTAFYMIITRRKR